MSPFCVQLSFALSSLQAVPVVALFFLFHAYQSGNQSVRVVDHKGVLWEKKKGIVVGMKLHCSEFFYYNKSTAMHGDFQQ